LHSGQLAGHRLPPPRVELATANLMPLACIANRSTRSERVPQDRQLLLYSPAPPTRYPANDLDPSGYTTARMTTRSFNLAIVQRRRSQKEPQSADKKPSTQGGLQTTLTVQTSYEKLDELLSHMLRMYADMIDTARTAGLEPEKGQRLFRRLHTCVSDLVVSREDLVGAHLEATKIRMRTNQAERADGCYTPRPFAEGHDAGIRLVG
jgi:hypothetical protein